MRLIKTSVELLTDIDAPKIYKFIELCGRVAYKSEERITDESAIPFIKSLIKRGHESVLEHVSITFRITTDRATANALVRHRVASYTQESTIYCDYGKQGELNIRDPSFIHDSSVYDAWERAMLSAEESYNKLRDLGVPPGVARDVLPNALKTELIMTSNIREWRHVIKQRMVPGDSKGMHLVIADLASTLSIELPVLFEDMAEDIVSFLGRTVRDA